MQTVAAPSVASLIDGYIANDGRLRCVTGFLDKVPS